MYSAESIFLYIFQDKTIKTTHSGTCEVLEVLMSDARYVNIAGYCASVRGLTYGTNLNKYTGLPDSGE